MPMGVFSNIIFVVVLNVRSVKQSNKASASDSKSRLVLYRIKACACGGRRSAAGPVFLQVIKSCPYGTVAAIAHSVCHIITLLDVPRWADPRIEAELRCHYAQQSLDPPLHSVKWYRGSHEIFRYTPQEYETRAFNSSGVSITNSSCDSMACVISIKPEAGTARYTCEVSSEGPRFAVDRKSANMTLAVLPEYEPLITGLPTFVNAGEQAFVNCTSDYSLPAATIDWFVDAEPQEDPVITGETHISGADGDGLRASWRTLHVFPDDYATHRGYLALECRATLPTRPTHVRSMAVRLYVASRPHISSYMLSKNNAVGKSGGSKLKYEFITWTFFLLSRNLVPCLVK